MDAGQLWQQVRDKMVLAVLGRLPDPPADVQLIRVSCEVAPAALRPLLEAKRLTEAILGEARAGRNKPRARTLFGESQERATEVVLVELWNRLARQTGARWIVVFDAVEQADDATLTALTHIVGRAGVLRLPLLLVFHGEPAGPAAELLANLRARDGESAVTTREAPAPAAPEFRWLGLPPRLLRVLRAGALIGPGFEVKLLAELLGIEAERALLRIQEAIDLGAPVEDRGEGRFSLPASAISALSASIMPSLAQAWHRKLGRLLGARAAKEAATPPPPPPPRSARFQAPALGDDRVADIIDLSHELTDLALETDILEPDGASPRPAGDLSPASGAGGPPADLAPAPAPDPATTTGPDPGAAAGLSLAPAPGAAASADLSSASAPGAAASADLSSASAAGSTAPVATDLTAPQRPDPAVDLSAGPRIATRAASDPAAPAAAPRPDPAVDLTAGPRSAAARPLAEPAVGLRSDPAAPAASAASPRKLVQRRTVLSPPADAHRARPNTMLLSPEVDLPAPPEVDANALVAAAELGDPLIDNVRAAEHMRLAGDREAAARHLCEAARQAADTGAPQTAIQHASEALSLLAALPEGVTRRRLKARALLEIGRVQWQAPGYDEGFTLAQARASLEAARAELDADAPLDLTTELAQAIAGVHYDLGDPPALARALAELEDAGRRLQAEGDAIGAASLFNDQAAVYVRMGEARQALRLLRASRAVFDARAQDDPGALRELADSEHLFAQLPLHSRMRLGREDEGYSVGMEHALTAERVFRELGDTRELARVWETMGRIELKRLRLDEARRRLEAAFEAQTQVGDLTGLAQTAEFLSEVLGWHGRNADAVAMLRDSVVYNRDKGSPRGLISNRRALTALAARFAQLPEHAEGLHEIEILLAAGERELGLTAATSDAAPG